MCEVLKIGERLPDFKFEAYNPVDGTFVSKNVKDILTTKKWLILFFYPADFTFVCPTELSDLAEKYDELVKIGADVISFSTDTKYVHLAWRNSEQLLRNVRFLMGADPAGKISRLLGVYDEETGLARRGTFIFDPEGKLVSVEISYDNVGRNADELLRKVKAHIYLSNHPDEVCPAKWREGDTTLRPSEKLIGKVGEMLKSK